MKDILEAMELLDARITRMAERACEPTDRRVNVLGDLIRGMSQRIERLESMWETRENAVRQLSERMDDEFRTPRERRDPGLETRVNRVADALSERIERLEKLATGSGDPVTP